MQDRMQSDSRLVNLFASSLVNPLFHLFLYASRTFPWPHRGYEIADQVMSAFFEMAPDYLVAVRGNLARILDLPVGHPRVECIARRMARQHAYAWVDFFRYGQRPPEEAIARFASLEGEHHMETARKGAILLTAHAGNFELGGLLLKARGMQVHAVYKPDRFAAVEHLRAQVRSAGGVVGVPVGGVGFSTLPLLKLLKEGRLVGMQGDRDFSLNGLPLPFFGREVHFPRGPWELAAMTGAPVIASFFWADEHHRFHARFFEPIQVCGERGERRASIEAGMRRYVALLEEFIGQHPDQWYCFYPFWDDPLRGQS